MKKIFLIILLLLFLPTTSFGYETDVHKQITRRTINLSSIEYYLNNNLKISLGDKFSNGIKSRPASEWLELGSEWEDDAPRWLNHFYDPTTGKGLGVGKPSLEWGKDSSFNSYSWKSARDYFYQALRGSSSNIRETSFADMFRSLGQIIHLIQDKAVPAHVRNDPHFPYVDTILHDKDMYEDYTRINESALTYNGYSSVYSNTDDKTFNIFDVFWKNSGKGLAEFTNSNFFSRDTNVDNPEHQPQYSSPTVTKSDQKFIETVTDAYGNSESVTVRYGLGTVVDKYKNEETPNVKLTAYSIWDFDYKKKMGKEVYSLNDTIHQTYASLLIPRAVGYSAGLLNYFFRGSIDMVRDTENDACKYVVYNLSNENMKGDFGLYYDDASGNRNNIASGDLTANAGEPSNPVTLDITEDLKNKSNYILVFKGTMGNETGAVVADAKVTPFTSSCGKELTITGPDTVSQDNSEQFEITGCTGCEDDVNWEITGEGATIDKTGLLAVDKTACGGTATITAKCPVCETEITKNITIPDSITISAPDSSNCYTASGGAGSYTWDISKGSIDSNGCVTTTTGQCGITTVTITDANGCKTTTTVTLPDTLTITGPEAPVDGSCYITTGGTEPYTWDITKGTIDEKGCVDLKGQCGTATITATNANGCTGTKELNIPVETLTITGSDTTTKNSTKQYTSSGCSSGVEWSVSGKGATINKTSGLLTTDGTACGSLTITASCPSCSTTATKSVRVTDAGQWVFVDQTQPLPGCGSGSNCGSGVYEVISGMYKHRYSYTQCQGVLSLCGVIPDNPCGCVSPNKNIWIYIDNYKWCCGGGC